jgi:hypothetical protein
MKPLDWGFWEAQKLVGGGAADWCRTVGPCLVGPRARARVLPYLAGEGAGKGQSRSNSKRVHTSVNAARMSACATILIQGNRFEPQA